MPHPPQCPTCPLATDPGRWAQIIEQLAATTVELKNVVDRLDRGADEFDRLHGLVRSIEHRHVEMEVRLRAVERSIEDIRPRVDVAAGAVAFVRASWRTLTVVAVCLSAVAGAVAWVLEHFVKR